MELNALDVDNAVQDFTTAIKIDPNDSDHYYKRGLARLINEDLVKALEDLNKALSIAPNPDSKMFIYATRGVVKLLQHREVDAQNDIEEAIKLSGDKGFIVAGYLNSLQYQITQMRQHRAKQQKSIV
jgi:tetratricopeptide (TPR) repeat protein